MKKKILLFILISLTKLSAQNENHLELGLPVSTQFIELQYIERQADGKKLYVVGYDNTLNSARWVAWNLSKDWYGDAPRFGGNFITDNIVDNPIKHTDITNSGYDRGHLVRSEERTLTDAQNKATFYMTNVYPQTPNLNQKVWYSLELYCEKLCKEQNKELYVIAGGIFSSGKKYNNKVPIPDTCWKIVVILEKGQGLKDVNISTQVIAVKMPNIDTVSGKYYDFLCTVDDIESSTTFNYLNKVENSIQDLIEVKKYDYINSVEYEEPIKKNEEKVIDVLGRPWVGSYEISKKVGNVRVVVR